MDPDDEEEDDFTESELEEFQEQMQYDYDLLDYQETLLEAINYGYE